MFGIKTARLVSFCQNPAFIINQNTFRQGRSDVYSNQAIAHRLARTTLINSETRFGSTAFHVFPSIFRLVPTITASARVRISLTFSLLTPVLAMTGTSGTAFLTSAKSDKFTGSPVIGPETQMASARLANTALCAFDATERFPTDDANSALIL